MEMNKNVVAAITTAVQLYMMAEQPVPAVDEAPRPLEAPRQGLSPWALSGRQSAMDMRRLWQMRLVR
jgi:hypothetical protein